MTQIGPPLEAVLAPFKEEFRCLRSQLFDLNVKLAHHEAERTRLLLLLRQLRDYVLEWPKGGHSTLCSEEGCVACQPIREWRKTLEQANKVLEGGE